MFGATNDSTALIWARTASFGVPLIPIIILRTIVEIFGSRGRVNSVLITAGWCLSGIFSMLFFGTDRFIVLPAQYGVGLYPFGYVPFFFLLIMISRNILNRGILPGGSRKDEAGIRSNAVKFTPDGGSVVIEAWIEADSDTVARGSPARVHVCVKDTGIGIREEYLLKIFEPFEQTAGTTTSRYYEGTELGLALSKSLIEMHGGRIWASSDGPGKGSAFHFTIPIRQG
jgi:hypothetical protein